MKKLEIIIQSGKLDAIRRILEEADVIEYYMTDMMKNSSHAGVVKKYRGARYPITQLPQVKVETVVTDDKADELVNKMVKAISTNRTKEVPIDHVADGKIFIYEVQNVINL